jgi:hypothetical protein
MSRAIAALSMSVLLAACGSSTPSESQSNEHAAAPSLPSPQSLMAGAADGLGAFEHGVAFAPTHAIFAEGDMAGMPGVFVVVSDDENLCAHIENFEVGANHTYVGVGIISPTPPLEAGDYPVGGGVIVVPQYFRFGNACSLAAPEGTKLAPQDGGINLSTFISGDVAIGNFHIETEDGFRGEGVFHATPCDGTRVLENLGIEGAACIE